MTTLNIQKLQAAITAYKENTPPVKITNEARAIFNEQFIRNTSITGYGETWEDMISDRMVTEAYDQRRSSKEYQHLLRLGKDIDGFPGYLDAVLTNKRENRPDFVIAALFKEALKG